MEFDIQKVKQIALNVFRNAHDGLTLDSWCIQVKNKLSSVNTAQIKKIIEEIIKEYWKVEYIIKNDEKIYIYHDLIK